MYERTPASGLFAWPRSAVAGAYTTSLGTLDACLVGALGRELELVSVPLRAGVGAIRRDLANAARDGCEALLVFDSRAVPAAVAARRKTGVPVAALISARDLRGRAPAALLRRVALSRIDDLLVDDEQTRALVATRLARSATTVVPPVARTLPEPSSAALAGIVKLLRGLPPGRLVVAMPWPDDRDQLRWYRDAVAPLLVGNPVVVLLGTPSRREARILVGASGMRTEFRTHTGAIDADVLAAAARCADVFVIPGATHRPVSLTDLIIAAVCSKVPLVAGGAVQSDVLEHERNALLVDPYDSFSMTATLNTLLSLPAVQRHYLGEDFAQHTLDRWTPERAAKAYAERLAALVGRPRIPAELRAA